MACKAQTSGTVTPDEGDEDGAFESFLNEMQQDTVDSVVTACDDQALKTGSTKGLHGKHIVSFLTYRKELILTSATSR